MSHAVGLSVVLLGTLFSGGSLYLSPRFDPVAALATLVKSRLTVFLGSPSMFSLLLDYAGMKGIKSLKFPCSAHHLLVGGAFAAGSEILC